MKDQFIPKKTQVLLLTLNYLDTDMVQFEGEWKILYQMAEEWLWKKHKIQIRISEDYTGRIFRSAAYWKNMICTGVLDDSNSPITAHRQGILKAIEHIHQNKK